MTRVLGSEIKKIQDIEDSTSKLSISEYLNATKGNKKVAKIKNKDKKQSDIWNINSILSNIFSYVDRKYLIEFNTVCKKWNNLTNPIIHKTIKLIRNRVVGIRGGVLLERTDVKYANADILECISNNAKHAHLVKEFKYDYKLESRKAIGIFQTFRFICSLTIEYCDMSQDQFLGMISPLTQLQELTLYRLWIKGSFEESQYKEAVQLPSSLRKLTMSNLYLIDNPKLFVQTISSHKNLVYFNYLLKSDNNYLGSFYKHYHSLLNFEFNDTGLENPKLLFVIFENNPQLISLKLTLEYISSEMVNHISKYLTNLEMLSLNEYNDYNHSYTAANLKFSQPAKIKKLSLKRIRLNSCSLNSILPNCPDLEELYISAVTFMQPDSIKLRLSNQLKLKKLSIHCDDLSVGVLDSILLNYHNIAELDICLPFEQEEVIKSICKKCTSLEKLEISSQLGMNEQEGDTLCLKFYESEFITGNHKCRFTLTNLVFNNFKIQDSKGEHFKSFEKLKSIKYTSQSTIYNEFKNEIDIDMTLWPGYRVLTGGFNNCDVELKRNLIN
jgi:hypothetical protein